METAFRPRSSSGESQDECSSRKIILSKESPGKCHSKMIEQEHPEAAIRDTENGNGIHGRVHVLETKEQEKNGGWEEEDEREGGGEEEEEEEEEEVIMAEEDMLRMLDKMEPPLAVCRRLFKVSPPIKAGTGEQDDPCPPRQEEETAVPWRVLTAPQRESFLCRGFAVVDCLTPPALTAAAYREATSRVSSGELKPAHGRSSGDTCRDLEGEDDPAVYLRSVRDDLTLLLSAENEMGEASNGIEEAVMNERLVEGKVTDGPAAGGSAIGRMLQALAALGEDLERMVRLRGRVEHQLAVYPGGIGARYERHRDAYPDDGLLSRHEDEPEGSGESSQTHSGSQESVSFRRVTAVCYLREMRPWTPSDGGALRLYPPAGACYSGGGSVDSEASGVISDDFGVGMDCEPGKEDGEDLFVKEVGIPVAKSSEPATRSPRVACRKAGRPNTSIVESSVIDEHNGPACGECFVDVAPLAGRTVIFLSGAVEHEVLPVTGLQPRAAITAWFH